MPAALDCGFAGAAEPPSQPPSPAPSSQPPSPGSAKSGEGGCALLTQRSRCYCVLFCAVLVPDLVAVLVYSPVGLGPDVYDGIANDHSNLLGNLMALVSAVWLMVVFVFDMFDSSVWDGGIRSILQCLSILLLAVLVFIGFTLKAVRYPWMPALLSMCTSFCLLAFKYVQWKKLMAGPPHFYLATAVCYIICASAIFMIWVVWITAADDTRSLWWDEQTERWLANKYARVYRQLTPDELASESPPLPLYEYCVDKGLIGSIESKAVQDLVKRACGLATNVIFIQWCGPFIVFTCNMLGAGFCLLFSNTIAKIKIDVQRAHPMGEAIKRSETFMKRASVTRKKNIVTFMKRFLLTIVLAVAIMYTSLYVSGAAVRLGSAMLALACIALFVMFMWLAQEVDTQTLSELKEDTPLMKHIINILQSNWMRAMAVGGLNVTIPLIVILDRVRQQVRKNFTNYYSEDHGSEWKKDHHTPSGRRLRESLAKWNWTDILGKVCVLAEVFVLLAVGSKATFVFFSFLNGVFEASGLEIGTICVMVWAIGLTMFLNPIVPGSAVYLFAGVVIGAQSQKDGSVGIWAGLVLACIAGSGAKLLACVGQYSLGYFASKSVKVQQFVGVTKVSVLATEAVLKEKGFKVFKVCILVAGPDFPTSVLCGILRLNIPQMLLGTSPIILVSIIPQTLVGVLLTKQNAAKGMWSMVGTVATGLAAVFQAGATLVFAYGIMKRVEESGEELLKTHRPEHEEVRRLAEKGAEYAKRHREMSDWGQLGTRARATLLVTVGLFLLSGFTIALDFVATEKICFRKFYITDKIHDSYELGGLDGSSLNVVLAPMGWIALSLSASAVVLHIVFMKWLAARAAANVVGEANSVRQASPSPDLDPKDDSRWATYTAVCCKE